MSVFSACVKPFVALTTLLFSAVLLAEEKKMTPPDPLASGGKVVFFLVLVVGLIFLMAWLVNKTRASSINFGGKSTNGLRIVSVLSLGLKEKIVVVQAGDKQLVVGVTSHQMTLLSELDEPLPVPEAQTVSFSELLKKAIRS